MTTNKQRLIYNAIRTPDGTVLVSRGVHDDKEYRDTVWGEEYMVDGGLEYIRRFVTKTPYEELSVHIEDGVEAYRNLFTWGTYGKSGTEPLHFVALADMTTEHINAILDDHRSKRARVNPNVLAALEAELQYRV